MSITMAFDALTDYWWIEHDVVLAKWLFLSGNILTNIIHNGCTLPMSGTLKSEILPQAVKGIGGSLSIIAHATAIIMGYQLYHFVSNNFPLYYLYVIFSIDSLILCILVYFRLPEGRGKTLADLQANFKNKLSTNESSENVRNEKY